MSVSLNEILATGKASPEEALNLFDSLPRVSPEFMFGRWKGFEIETGHPMDGLLVPSGWYGKMFLSHEEVHPLIFFGSDKTELYAVNPKLIPFNMQLPKGERLGSLMNMARIVLETTESKARLRNLEYRGSVSATMIYDDIPVMDTFVKIDDNRVLGVMDLKGQPLPYFFGLERDDESVYEVAPLKAADERFKKLFDMEVQNRAFALKGGQHMAENASSEADKLFFNTWVRFEQFLQQAYAPYAAKYGLSQEARGKANLQVGISKLASNLLPASIVFQTMLNETIDYLEKLKELDRVAPEADATFFSFVVKQEEVQIEALKLRLEDKNEEVAHLLSTFIQEHSQ